MSPARLDPGAVRRTLRSAGLVARKRFGQNFLADVEVLEAILDVAAVTPGRTVLEIGPGLGILTGALLDAGAALTAVELDEGMVRHLAHALADRIELAGETRPPTSNPPGSLRLVEGSVLDVDLHGLLAPPYDVVANIPYHVTSPILHVFLGGEAPRPERCVLMVQREVGERITARPGDLSYLGVFVQYHAAARLVRKVPREAFEPPPDVESAIVALEVRPVDAPGRLPPEMEDHLWRLVQAGFRERRKMIHNVLVRQLPLSSERLGRALDAVGIEGTRRPQTLSVAEWIALLGELGPLPEARPGRRGRAEEGPDDDEQAGQGAGAGREAG